MTTAEVARFAVARRLLRVAGMQTRNSILVGLYMTALVPVLVGGCAAPGAGGSAVAGDTGSVGLALQLAPGVDVSSASWTITGPGGASRMGTVDLHASSMLSFTVGGLPAGNPYSVAVSASSGGLSCSGSSSFAVVAHATAQAVVQIQCQQAPTNGSAHITGVFTGCPVVDGVSASPAEVFVGGSLALSGTAHDVDAQPLTYAWSAPSGTFSNAAISAPTFTCTAAGSVAVSLTVSDGHCSDTLATTVVCTGAPLQIVYASVETDPVPHAGDAADDPAIWVNTADPAQSTIIGTDKTAMGGLGVYDLAGHQIQFVAGGALNNVDVRNGFPLGGAQVPLVTAGNRNNNTLAIYKIDPATRLLSDVAARPITTLAVYGSCMYHSPVTGKFYYFVDSKAGDIEQWELFDDGSGHVDATKIRNLHKLGTQPEACVTDDELGLFYIGEEDVGIWKFNAEPGGAPSDPLTNGVLVDTTGPGGHLVADVEGLTIARTGPGTGYLIAANQGDSTYAIYTREGTNTYLKTFQVAGACGVDEVTGSDGIDVTTTPLGPAFPAGVFVTQDDTNAPAPGNQNFKLVPLQDILGGPVGAPVCGGGSDAGADAGTVAEGGASSDGGAPEAPAGFPAAFCAEFCGKCDTCWHANVGFNDGDCLYHLTKPNFTVDDCMTGCAIGATPGFPPSNLQPGWQAMECVAWDDSM
jgi:3-phytase